MIRPGDSPVLRKERGAFFTPPEIADYLADWAVGGDRNARILDPTCGEASAISGRRERSRGRRRFGNTCGCLVWPRRGRHCLSMPVASSNRMVDWRWCCPLSC